jgi:hypothetical protein
MEPEGSLPCSQEPEPDARNILHKTVILPVLYGCETWSVTLREERILRVFEYRVMRRIFVPKWVKVAGGWKGLHNEELHNLYAVSSIIMMSN